MSYKSKPESRSTRDVLFLIASGAMIAPLFVGAFWLLDELSVPQPWRVFAFMNVGFVLLMFWYLRKLLRDRVVISLLSVWVIAHFAVYAALSQFGVSSLINFILFPVEAILLVKYFSARFKSRRIKQRAELNQQ